VPHAGALCGSCSEFKLVARQKQCQGVRTYISKAYVIRLIIVSGFLSNHIPVIYQPARIW